MFLLHYPNPFVYDQQLEKCYINKKHFQFTSSFMMIIYHLSQKMKHGSILTWAQHQQDERWRSSAMWIGW